MAAPFWNATGANQTYSTNGNWSTGSAPAADDTVGIDGRSQNNIDGANVSAADLQSFRVSPAYGGTIGSSGTSLTLAVSNETTSSDPRFTFAGSGAAYIAAGGNGIDYLDIQRAPGGFWLTGGTTAEVFVSGGRVNIGASATVTTLYILGGEVTIAQGATVGTIIKTGGTLVSEAGCTTFTQGGAIPGRASFRESAAITTANIYAGIFNFGSTGTLGTCNLYSGTLTPAGAKYNVTVTTLNRYAGSNFVRSASGVTVTVGTEAEIGDTSRDQFGI